MRYHHYAYRTEQTYCQWILRYIHFFGGKTHPKELTTAHVQRYLSSLTTKSKVAISTQKQALNALVFLYREVLDLSLEGKLAPIRAKRRQKPPTVLTQKEVQRLLQNYGCYTRPDGKVAAWLGFATGGLPHLAS